MTKRLANRAVVQHLNLTLDAVAYAEWLELPAVGGVAERWTEPRYKKIGVQRTSGYAGRIPTTVASMMLDVKRMQSCSAT